MRLRTTAFYLSTALLIRVSCRAEHPTYQVGPQADGSL